MFQHARAAGLPMLGGLDITINHNRHQVRGHFWATNAAACDPESASASAPPAFTSVKTIVILPGFTEFCEKYAAEFLRFHQMGFNVLGIDWPGQGQSGHFGYHWLAVHCTDFDDHLKALDRLIETVGLGSQPITLFGHSMGGHLALRYAAWRADLVQGVILSAPMMAPPAMPVWLIRTASYALGWVGMTRAHPPFHRVLTLDLVRLYWPENPLTRDMKGYEDQFVWFDDAPELRRSGPTVGWVSAAYRSTALYTLNPDWLASIGVPVLALLAGDERVVHAPSTDFALLYLPDVEVVKFDGARHELTRETADVTDRLWVHVDKFLNRLDLCGLQAHAYQDKNCSRVARSDSENPGS